MNGRSSAVTNGLVVVDKPSGMTSHDVVARCRRIFGQRRVGHAGTLDPDATGVLLVGLGSVTRLLRFLTPLPKTYAGELALGATTTTLDASGEVTATFDMSGVTSDDVAVAAAKLTGPILQTPPMVSAVKVGGQRLHALARQGLEVERPARPVTVHRFETEPSDAPLHYRFEVECSSGTYVRSLAADLGASLGGGAHLVRLRRTSIGPFRVDDAVALEDLEPGRELSPAEAVAHLETATLADDLALAVSRGRPLDRVVLGLTGAGPFRLIDGEGRLLAVYAATPSSRIVADVVIAEPT